MIIRRRRHCSLKIHLCPSPQKLVFYVYFSLPFFEKGDYLKHWRSTILGIIKSQENSVISEASQITRNFWMTMSVVRTGGTRECDVSTRVGEPRESDRREGDYARVATAWRRLRSGTGASRLSAPDGACDNSPTRRRHPRRTSRATLLTSNATRTACETLRSLGPMVVDMRAYRGKESLVVDSLRRRFNNFTSQV